MAAGADGQSGAGTMLRHLAYVVPFVEDLERSLAFYLEKLGMAVRHRTEG